MQAAPRGGRMVKTRPLGNMQQVQRIGTEHFIRKGPVAIRFNGLVETVIFNSLRANR